MEPFFICTEDITWKTFGILIHEYVNPTERRLTEIFQIKYRKESKEKNKKEIELKDNITSPRELDGTINSNYILYRGDKMEIINSLFISFPPKARPSKSDLMKALNDMGERLVLEENYIQPNDEDEDESEERTRSRCIPCILYKQNDKEKGLWIAKALIKKNNLSIVKECIEECFHHHTRDRMYEGTQYEIDRFIVTGEQMFQNPHLLDNMKVYKKKNHFLHIKNQNEKEIKVESNFNSNNNNNILTDDIENVIFLKHFVQTLKLEIHSLSEIHSNPKNIENIIFKKTVNDRFSHKEKYPIFYVLEEINENYISGSMNHFIIRSSESNINDMSSYKKFHCNSFFYKNKKNISDSFGIDKEKTNTKNILIRR